MNRAKIVESFPKELSTVVNKKDIVRYLIDTGININESPYTITKVYYVDDKCFNDPDLISILIIEDTCREKYAVAVRDFNIDVDPNTMSDFNIDGKDVHVLGFVSDKIGLIGIIKLAQYARVYKIRPKDNAEMYNLHIVRNKSQSPLETTRLSNIKDPAIRKYYRLYLDSDLIDKSGYINIGLEKYRDMFAEMQLGNMDEIVKNAVALDRKLLDTAIKNFGVEDFPDGTFTSFHDMISIDLSEMEQFYKDFSQEENEFVKARNKNRIIKILKDLRYLSKAINKIINEYS